MNYFWTALIAAVGAWIFAYYVFNPIDKLVDAVKVLVGKAESFAHAALQRAEADAAKAKASIAKAAKKLEFWKKA